MKCDYTKHGWAILTTFADGSSGFVPAEGTGFPKIWRAGDRGSAIAAMKKLPPNPYRCRHRVVKVKANWPEIL